jgi:hypothetical protein
VFRWIDARAGGSREHVLSRADSPNGVESRSGGESWRKWPFGGGADCGCGCVYRRLRRVARVATMVRGASLGTGPLCVE